MFYPANRDSVHVAVRDARYCDEADAGPGALRSIGHPWLVSPVRATEGKDGPGRTGLSDFAAEPNADGVLLRRH